MNNKGITLVSLVITIIVMLILAGVSLSMVLGDGSVLDQAKNASTATVLASIKEEFELNKTGRKMQELVKNNGQPNKGKEVVNPDGSVSYVNDSGIYAFGEDVKTYIPNIDEGYIGKIGIFNDEIIFVGEDLTDEEKASAAGQGIATMNDEDYKYMFLMKKLEGALLAKKDAATKPGTALSLATQIDIAGIKYGASWYRIDVGNLAALGFTPEEITIMDQYDPFVGRFDSGEVLSDPGRTMYADNPDKKIHKYTFNYFGEKDGIVVADMVTGVDPSSTRDAGRFGDFIAADGSFVYDTSDNNALKFTGGAIGEIPINSSIHINTAYSINITVKCDVFQQSPESTTQSTFPTGVTAKHHRSMIAISDDPNEYVCWMGVDGGILRVYNYRQILSTQTWNSNKKGFLWVDVSEYDNKYMNIQFTVEREGKARLYINGELKAEGDAGYEQYTYKTLTIGDLRRDRELKYLGNMYNVSIYAKALTATEVKQNYEAVKKSIVGWN